MTAQKKIYDCCIFYNELELLQLRCEQMYDHVDHMVICEATVTFQGKPKPLHYALNKDRFARYADKIIHIVVDDMPPAPENPAEAADEAVFWNREHFQRNALRRGLTDAKPDDIVIIADCDEILTEQALATLRANDGYFLLDMPMYQFFLNTCAQEAGWRKAFAYTYAMDAELPDYNLIRRNELHSYELFPGRNHYVRAAGWHFTFLGGASRVKDKLSAYSHTDGWQAKMRDEALLGDQMLALREVGGNKVLRFKRIDASFPAAIRDNLQHYVNIGFVKDEWTRFQELENLWAASDNRYREIAEAQDQALRSLQGLRRSLQQNGIDIAALVNMIPSSTDFGIGWNPGMQTAAPGADASVPSLIPGNTVLRHERDGEATTADPNVGYYSRIAVVPGKVYSVSCFILLPMDFAGTAADISIGDWPHQRKGIARVDIRGRWQRIASTCLVPESAAGLNLVLRVYGTKPSVIFSTCWQLEEGDQPSAYNGTTVEA